MNYFTKLSSYTVATILSKTAHFVANNRSNLSFPIKLQYPLLTRSYYHHHNRYCSEFELSRFLRVRCYSAKKGSKRALQKKVEEECEAMVMEEEKDAFYVVRKGDIVGIYNCLSDCQAQVGSSVCDPPVSVYKGYSLSKDTEEYLVSHGLKNALYTIRAADLGDDLFDTLVPCPFKEPASTKGCTSNKDVSKKRSLEVLGQDNVEPASTEGCTSNKDVSKKRSLEVLGQDNVNVTSLTSNSEDPLRKQVKLDRAALTETRTCLLEFDGASKGNPGKAGAGAILRASDGSLICRLREGVGIATCNAAEYRAMILGMRCALEKGFKDIRIKGDSKLVCMQISGSWRVKNENLSTLYKVAKKLKDNFSSFQISHVLRDFNSEADAQANLAINLADGEVQEECVD